MIIGKKYYVIIGTCLLGPHFLTVFSFKEIRTISTFLIIVGLHSCMSGSEVNKLLIAASSFH